MSTEHDVCVKDALQFLTIYGDDGRTGSTARRTAAKHLKADLQGRGAAALPAVQAFLREHYGSVVGQGLSGADGLDMDEAWAAQLSENVRAKCGAVADMCPEDHLSGTRRQHHE